MRRSAPALLLLALLVATAGAQSPGTRAERALFEGTSPQDVRTRLMTLADSALAADPETAGEALYYAGSSYERSSMPDSAIDTYARALQIRKGHEERLALIDALLRRRAPGDAAQAIDLARQGREAALMGRGALAADYGKREAWAEAVAARPDTALVLFEPYQDDLQRTAEGRYRLGVAQLEAANPRKAFALLLPLAIASRARDKEVMKRIDQISEATRVGGRLRNEIERQVALRDRDEKLFLDSRGGRRLRFLATDGFRLGGVRFAPSGTARRRAAVVLMAPGDSIADYDSLAFALRKAGLAVLMMDVRGSGQSVDEMAPLPDTWRGREERLQSLVAHDVRVGLRALATTTPLDTSSYLLGGVGASAPIAIRAASLDRRVKALVLVSPELAPVERGPTRARVADLQLPVFYQIGPDDRPHLSVTEALFHAGAERRSRIAETKLVGRGALQFYGDPSVTARLTRWVKESMPAAPASRASRRPSPRKG